MFKFLSSVVGWLRPDARCPKALLLSSSTKQGEEIEQKACGLR